MGVLFVLLGFLCVAILNALCKSLSVQVPLGLLLFVQNFFAFCFCAPLLFKTGLKTKRFGLHFVRMLAGLLSYACLFYAIPHISLLDATLLANSAPLFLPFVIFFWFGQKIDARLWIALIIGFIGVFLIINPVHLSALFTSWVVLIALLGSLFSAIALQAVKYLKESEETSTINLYYFGMSALLTSPWLVSNWSSVGHIDWPLWIGMGLFLALTQYFLATAYRYESPTVLGPFNYSVVIFTGILGWMFWREAPNLMDAMGVLLICFGGILSLKYLGKNR